MKPPNWWQRLQCWIDGCTYAPEPVQVIPITACCARCGRWRRLV